ncbi:MAG: cell division protein ZapA [Candidatus Latescibacterota bacterium]
MTPPSLVVSIFGKNYPLALEPGQSADAVREVAHLVDQAMRQVHHEHPSPTPLRTAVLAGLNLVEELFALQAEYRDAEADIAQRTSRLATSLGRLFVPAPVGPAESPRG